MVEILPFNGLVYNIAKISDISEVLAPPYDIISEKDREYLKKLNPYNIVKLTLPDETDGKNKYESAKINLDNWIRNDILVCEDSSCIYLMEERFLEKDEEKSFFGFIALLKIEEYEKGKVLRHEMTLSKPKEDRLNLLKACRTNFEFIYTIYNDDDKKIYQVLAEIVKDKPVLSTSVDYDESINFKLWKISDKTLISKIISLLKTKTILIADGHHRYETSRLYKQFIQSEKDFKKNTGETDDIAALPGKNHKPEDYILTLFVAGNQKDIAIHPTHRAVKFNKEFLPEKIIPIIDKYFTIEIIKEPSEHLIKQKMDHSSSTGRKSLVIITAAGEPLFITLKSSIKDIYRNLGIIDKSFNEFFENLDVNLLHKLLLGKLLNEFEIKDIKFIHTISELFKIIEQKNNDDSYDAGFILNAPSIKTVETLSSAGLIMPQKSTYFYPKPCSGLVLYKFDK
ncbi:MAG: DUF1015 domain-containing protein [Actinobacteria bacterium]|nr:DUF1015 domain-containing protein [Actinomycetota bacterium]MBM3712912.1 DUF1015 domain-containing protein [Actinomycetota bacterium]